MKYLSEELKEIRNTEVKGLSEMPVDLLKYIDIGSF